MNFAFIDDPFRYHTPSDTVDNLDPRSVQHHGENALAVTRHFLGITHDDFAAKENAVFFTVLGHWLLYYPQRLAVPLAVAVLAVQLLGTRRSRQRGATA